MAALMGFLIGVNLLGLGWNLYALTHGLGTWVEWTGLVLTSTSLALYVVLYVLPRLYHERQPTDPRRFLLKASVLGVKAVEVVPCGELLGDEARRELRRATDDLCRGSYSPAIRFGTATLRSITVDRLWIEPVGDSDA